MESPGRPAASADRQPSPWRQLLQCRPRGRAQRQRDHDPGQRRVGSDDEACIDDYVPQNTVTQHFAGAGGPLRLLSGQNRLFKQLGYDNVAYLNDASDDDAADAVA